MGACLLVPITEFLSEEFGGTLPGLHLFIYGIVMILVVLYMPKGIFHPVTKLFKNIEGTPEQVANDPRAISAYLGEDYHAGC